MINKPFHRLLFLIILSVWSGFSFANLSDTISNANRASEVAVGMTTTYTYDSVNCLTQKAATGYGMTYTQTLTYFANGQIKTKTEKLTDNGTDVQDIAVTYTYDKLGRLTQSVTTDPLLGDATVTYAFDKVSNRLTHALNGVTTAYTYNQNDQLLSAGGITYTYDANGNTLTQTEGGSTITYTYDARNKLTNVTENGKTITRTDYESAKRPPPRKSTISLTSNRVSATWLRNTLMAAKPKPIRWATAALAKRWAGKRTITAPTNKAASNS